MKKIFLCIGLLNVCHLAHAEFVNNQNQPVTEMSEVAKWQPKSVLIPLLDRWYADIPQIGVSYQEFQEIIKNHDTEFFDKPNASHQEFQFFGNFMESGFNPSASQEHVKEAEKLYKYLSLYIGYALDLILERSDLAEQYIKHMKEMNERLTQKEIKAHFEQIKNKTLKSWVGLTYYFMANRAFEKEVENSVQAFLHNKYLN